LPKLHIEDEASLLLAEFGGKHCMVTAPPIPIDDIIEVYLRLTVEFKDMQRLFGVGDVHGALWVNRQLVGVDISLDPEQYPAKRGRYHFTLAHETGHWRLHRRHYQRPKDQPLLKLAGIVQPEYVCRSTDRNRIELQANEFAACLLMPREMVKRAWHEWRGTMDPIYLQDLADKRRAILTAEVFRRGSVKPGDHAVDDMLLEHCSRPLAEQFQVSAEAMRIRLEDLWLLLRKKEASLFQ
jgi:Zn-dependent peptidase ImmA (M78 family)